MAKPLAALALLCFAHAAIGFRAVPPAMTTSVAARPQFYGKPWQCAMRRVLKPIRKPAGWFLVYADVSPYDESTAEGAAFIATNVVFFALGAQLATAGGMHIQCVQVGQVSPRIAMKLPHPKSEK